MSSSQRANARRANPRIARRTRRGLTVSGWLALLIGAASGFLQTRPSLVNEGLALLWGTVWRALEIAPEARPVWLSHPPVIPTSAVALLSIALIGLVSGGVVGLWLKGAHGLLRLLVALFAVLVGLMSAEVVRGALSGLSVGDSLRFANDSLEALLIAVGGLGAMLGIRIGRTSPPVQSPVREAQQPAARPAAHRVTLAQRVRRAAPSIDVPSLPTVRRPRISLPVIRLPQLPSRVRTTRRPTAAGGSDSPITVRGGRTAGRRRVSRRRRNVHLSREGVGVCPYCLEEVAPDDPRGRVVCDICGTPHHGDCWAVAGKCQVPHL